MVMDNRWWIMVNGIGQWMMAMVNDQWSMDNGQWTMDSLWSSSDIMGSSCNYHGSSHDIRVHHGIIIGSPGISWTSCDHQRILGNDQEVQQWSTGIIMWSSENTSGCQGCHRAMVYPLYRSSNRIAQLIERWLFRDVSSSLTVVMVWV